MKRYIAAFSLSLLLAACPQSALASSSSDSTSSSGSNSSSGVSNNNSGALFDTGPFDGYTTEQGVFGFTVNGSVACKFHYGDGSGRIETTPYGRSIGIDCGQLNPS